MPLVGTGGGRVDKGPTQSGGGERRQGGEIGRGSGSQGRTGGPGPRGGLQHAGARTVGGGGNLGGSRAQKAFDAKYAGLNAARTAGVINDAGRYLGRSSGLGGLSMGAGGGRPSGGTNIGGGFGPMGFGGARNYSNAVQDVMRNDLATQAFGLMTGIREMGPIPSKPETYLGGRAQWGGPGPIGMGVGAIGSAFGSPFGPGIVAGNLEALAGYPLGRVNFGQDVLAGNWSYDAPSWAGGFPRGNYPGSAADQTSSEGGTGGMPGSSGSLNPGRSANPRSGQRGFGREPRQMMTTAGYIRSLMG